MADVLYDRDGNPIFPSTTLRREVGGEVKREMRQYLVDTMFDRVAHAEAVAAGRFTFREVFMQCLGPYFGRHRAPCDVLADSCFQFLEVQWRERYPETSPRAFLNAVHIASPQSQAAIDREIDDAWELEIGGSEDALRQFYEGSARTRKGADLGSKRVNVGKVGLD